jgi:N-carbamoyl-L-amino-acid hydrolase
MTAPKLPLDSDRLAREIDELALISEVPAPAVTRILFSKADFQARDYVKSKAAELGLTLREDGVGNLFARWVGTQPELAAVASGSHIDAIPNAGKFDGVVGVLGVLAAFRALKAAGFQPTRSLELILFTSEEPTRFGLGCLGSRLLSRHLPPEEALALKDRDGKTLATWLAETRFAAQPLTSVALPPEAYRAFVELHIEQGPLLEKEKIDIGVVEKIAAPSAFRFRLEGKGGHAGAVLMPGRRDALLAGCEIALGAEAAALNSASADTVATTGVLRIEPGAINSIPYRALVEIDLRDTNPATRNHALATIRQAAEAICARRNIGMEYEQINLDPPALCDASLVETALREAQAHGYSTKKMVSRAYHDSLFMAQICPITMIFIPCREGVSHRPDEYASPEQIARGVITLAGTLAALSQS